MPCRTSFGGEFGSDFPTNSRSRFDMPTGVERAPVVNCRGICSTLRCMAAWATYGNARHAPRVIPLLHYLRKACCSAWRLYSLVFPSNNIVNKVLIRKITEHSLTTRILSQDISLRDKTNYCPFYASLAHQTAITQNGAGVPLAAHVAILSWGTDICVQSRNRGWEV